MTRRKSLQWVDFKKIMISETGQKCAEPYLSRSSSNDEQGTFSITSFPSFGDTGSCASSLSSDDNTNHVRGILKAPKRSGKPLQKRSLLHSFERPSRNIETFVKSALSYTAPKNGSDSTDSDEDYKTKQKMAEKRGRKPKNGPKERNTRSMSLDRDKLQKSSFSIYSESSQDTKSQQSSDERISLKSDLLGYRGHLQSGVRTKPKNRHSTYNQLINRHERGDFAREFNRNQRNCISRVEYIFDKSHRDVEMALIDMKIDLAYKSRY